MKELPYQLAYITIISFKLSLYRLAYKRSDQILIFPFIPYLLSPIFVFAQLICADLENFLRRGPTEFFHRQTLNRVSPTKFCHCKTHTLGNRGGSGPPVFPLDPHMNQEHLPVQYFLYSRRKYTLASLTVCVIQKVLKFGNNFKTTHTINQSRWPKLFFFCGIRKP